MNTGLKVWLWVVLVCNALGAIGNLTMIALSPLYIITALASVVIIVGVSMLLFKMKKIGFYLLCAAAVLSFIFNIIVGVNIAIAIVGLVVAPGITYLLMKSTWEDFQ